MKIALINEFSQASKNPVIIEQLENVASQHDHRVFNVGMRGDDDHRLTYIHLGIIASILLNTKAVDFVITGCGTGQGALMSLNAHPGVECGYCIEPTDAYLFAQVNKGNALALPFAKGYGWGAELNIRYIFEKAFTGVTGQGYPPERKASQMENASILSKLKKDIAKDFLVTLKEMDRDLLVTATTSDNFKACFLAHHQNDEVASFLASLQ